MGRKRVRRLMKKMGTKALYRKPGKGYTTYPYRLRGITIDKPNRVWAMDIKYEEVYLHAYDSVSEAKTGIARYIDVYNRWRPHSKLDKQTPDDFHYRGLSALLPA